jgi:nucleotide-binding universal stress UspA family protein
MNMLKRILVPHDFGEQAAAAMNYAAGLAKVFGSTCDVLHVTGHATPGVHPGFEYRSGVPHEEIVRYASDCSVDLIAMGTHGRRGLAHAVMGSVAEKVVRTAPCPVVTVRCSQPNLHGANILVPIDWESMSECALAYARSLARALGGRLHLLHAVENHFMRAMVADPVEFTANVRRLLADRLTDEDKHALQATVTVDESDSPAYAIVDFAARAQIDLIVMGTHGRRAAERFFVGSVAERVLRTAPCPVLTLRYPAVTHSALTT